MPFEMDEYYRGQLFAVSEASKNETGGGDGVEVLEDDDFTSTTVRPGHYIKGLYTHKIYRTKSKSPWALRKIFPDAAFVLHEECWNAFPYCKTVIKNPDYMKDSFYINIESIHIPDKGETENALDLSQALLKKREVIIIDIYDDSFLKRSVSDCMNDKDITPETDVREFESKKTGRGKLCKDWVHKTKPVMCCYKVVQVYFKMFGLQTMVERLLQKQYPRIFSKFNRELYCWTDRWYDMTVDDIRKMEKETTDELKKQIIQPKKRGIVCDMDDKES